MTSSPTIRGVLLDIEGTTTPISFVHEVLFPYARAHVRNYLAAHLNEAETKAGLAELRAEHAIDLQGGLHPPALVTGSEDAESDSFARYVEWLIDRDRKSSGLKSLQGKIWEQGYRVGSIVAPLFPDVWPALKGWRRVGLKVAIFSSGSVLAQRLLFAHTEAGDVTRFIDCYFDTTTGPKLAMESYQLIATRLSLNANELLFISDALKELDAAAGAGFQTLLCMRPGNQPQPENRHRIIRSFDEIVLTAMIESPPAT